METGQIPVPEELRFRVKLGLMRELYRAQKITQEQLEQMMHLQRGP